MTQACLWEDNYMSNKEKTSNRKTRSGSGLLNLLVDIISHPAMASYTPAGPGSLATGQVGAAESGGNLPQGGRWEQPESGSHAGFSGDNLEWSRVQRTAS